MAALFGIADLRKCDHTILVSLACGNCFIAFPDSEGECLLCQISVFKVLPSVQRKCCSVCVVSIGEYSCPGICIIVLHGSNKVSCLVITDSDCDSMNRLVIGDTGSAAFCFSNPVGICSFCCVMDPAEALCITAVYGNGCTCRNRCIILSCQCECEGIASLPVTAAQDLLCIDLSIGISRCIRVVNGQRISGSVAVIGDISLLVVGDSYLDCMNRCVIGDTLFIAGILGDLIFIDTVLCVFNRSPGSNEAICRICCGCCFSRHRCTINRCQREGEGIVGIQLTAAHGLCDLELCIGRCSRTEVHSTVGTNASAVGTAVVVCNKYPGKCPCGCHCCISFNMIVVQTLSAGGKHGVIDEFVVVILPVVASAAQHERRNSCTR